MHELLELSIKSRFSDTDSTGDIEECKRESETVVFAGVLLALLAMFVWSLTLKIWFEQQH